MDGALKEEEDLYGSVKMNEHPLMNGFEKADLPFMSGQWWLIDAKFNPEGIAFEFLN